MKQFYYLLIFHLFFCFSISAQIDTSPAGQVDTLPRIDSSKLSDTLLIKVNPVDTRIQPPPAFESSKRPFITNEWKLDPSISIERQILQHHPYFGFNAEPIVVRSDKKIFQGKEILFYSLILLLIMYALLRQAFPKYFNDLFRLFFRTTIKQRQIKEQLMQTPLPSILLNGFFVLSAGLYLSFLIMHYKISPVENSWLLFLYCVLGLSGIYLLKFLGLKITGWVFSMKEAADSYLFIVFIINKMAGLLLLPFLVLLAFTSGNIYSIALTLSFFVIAGLLAYRFLLTYTVIRNQVKVNPFQFFLYLCAFEIAPLLLVYKLLLNYFTIST